MSAFQFKQFGVEQDRCAMKVGTDGVLLGAWVGISAKTNAVLDIGTGTGIVALMLAQRLSEQQGSFHIDAIEIDAEAAVQARQNFSQSPWSSQLAAIHSSLQEFGLSADQTYDLIVSNPPFYNATLKPDDEARAIARHKDALPVDAIARFARQHLTPEGRLSLIYPTEYDTEVMTAMIVEGLRPIRICDVLTKEGKPCKRRMAEFARRGSIVESEVLAIRDKYGKYTLPYRQLTDAFYLHLTD